MKNQNASHIDRTLRGYETGDDLTRCPWGWDGVRIEFIGEIRTRK
jgi:hypothetical protein